MDLTDSMDLTDLMDLMDLWNLMNFIGLAGIDYLIFDESKNTYISRILKIHNKNQSIL